MTHYPATAAPEQIAAHQAACLALESAYALLPTGDPFNLTDPKDLAARNAYLTAHYAASVTYRAIWPVD